MSKGYYLSENGEQVGPFTFEELTTRGLDVLESILPDESDTWQIAGDLPEFYTYFENKGIYLPTGDNLASFGWRLLAYIVDNLVLTIIMDIVFYLLPYLGITFKVPTYSELFKLPVSALLTLTLINSVALILYNAVCEASPMEGSIGKRIFRMVVVDVNGQGQTIISALIRSFGKALSIFFFYSGFISIFFTEHKQALHDFMAKTYVVKREF